MEFNKFIEVLFKEAEKAGFEEYEVYYTDSESLSINIYKEEVDKYKLTNSYGLSFRGKIGNKIGYSYTQILDKDAIDMMVKNAKESALVIESNDVQFIYAGDKSYKEVESYYSELENINPQDLIELGMQMERECKLLSDKVHNFSACGIGYSNSNYGIINSKGLNSHFFMLMIFLKYKRLEKLADGEG